MTTGQSDRGNFLTEVPYSQSTLDCIKLTKTNQNRLVNIREVRVKQLNIGEGGREGVGEEKEEGGRREGWRKTKKDKETGGKVRGRGEGEEEETK